MSDPNICTFGTVFEIFLSKLSSVLPRENNRLDIQLRVNRHVCDRKSILLNSPHSEGSTRICVTVYKNLEGNYEGKIDAESWQCKFLVHKGTDGSMDPDIDALLRRFKLHKKYKNLQTLRNGAIDNHFKTMKVHGQIPSKVLSMEGWRDLRLYTNFLSWAINVFSEDVWQDTPKSCLDFAPVFQEIVFAATTSPKIVINPSPMLSHSKALLEHASTSSGHPKIYTMETLNTKGPYRPIVVKLNDNGEYTITEVEDTNIILPTYKMHNYVLDPDDVDDNGQYIPRIPTPRRSQILQARAERAAKLRESNKLASGLVSRLSNEWKAQSTSAHIHPFDPSTTNTVGDFPEIPVPSVAIGPVLSICAETEPTSGHAPPLDPSIGNIIDAMQPNGADLLPSSDQCNFPNIDSLPPPQSCDIPPLDPSLEAFIQSLLDDEKLQADRVINVEGAVSVIQPQLPKGLVLSKVPKTVIEILDDDDVTPVKSLQGMKRKKLAHKQPTESPADGGTYNGTALGNVVDMSRQYNARAFANASAATFIPATNIILPSTGSISTTLVSQSFQQPSSSLAQRHLAHVANICQHTQNESKVSALSLPPHQTPQPAHKVQLPVTSTHRGDDKMNISVKMSGHVDEREQKAKKNIGPPKPRKVEAIQIAPKESTLHTHPQNYTLHLPIAGMPLPVTNNTQTGLQLHGPIAAKPNPPTNPSQNQLQLHLPKATTKSKDDKVNVSSRKFGEVDDPKKTVGKLQSDRAEAAQFLAKKQGTPAPVQAHQTPTLHLPTAVQPQQGFHLHLPIASTKRKDRDDSHDVSVKKARYIETRGQNETGNNIAVPIIGRSGTDKAFISSTDTNGGVEGEGDNDDLFKELFGDLDCASVVV